MKIGHWVGCISVLISGCASVPRDAGFSDVQGTVIQRTGQRVVWDRGTERDLQVVEMVRKLLGEPLSAESAVQIALLNNQNLQATYEDLGVAQADLVEAGLLRNPAFSAEARLPKYTALPFDFSVTQSFLDLFTMPLRKRVAGEAFEAAKQRVTHEVLGTAARAQSEFYRLQGAEQQVELRETIVRAADASFEAASRLREAGNITELALANEQALFERAKIDLASAQRAAREARDDLNLTLGLAGEGDSLKVEPHLRDIPNEDLDAAQLEARAIDDRNDLAAAFHEVNVAGRSLGLSRYAVWGDVSVGAHLSRETDGATSVGPSVLMPLPIFNQGQAGVAAAAARWRQSRHRYAALLVEVRNEVRRALHRMSAARETADLERRVILPLRRKIVEETQLRYNGMLVGVFELLQAKQAEIDAGHDYVAALQEYWVSRAELERAVGGRLSSGGATTRPAGGSFSPSPGTPGEGRERGPTQHHPGEAS